MVLAPLSYNGTLEVSINIRDPGIYMFCRGATVPCIMLVLGGNLVGGINFQLISSFCVALLPQVHFV